MEIENCVKRHQRLEGEDHFANPEKRPQRLEQNGTINPDDILSDNYKIYIATPEYLEKYLPVIGVKFDYAVFDEIHNLKKKFLVQVGLQGRAHLVKGVLLI